MPMYEYLGQWSERFIDAAARLDLWDTRRPRDGKSQLRYALAIVPDDLNARVTIIEGEDFYPSPYAIDSDETAAALLSFMAHYGESIHYSGDDADVSDDLTARQRETLACYHEALSMWEFDLHSED